MRAFALLAFAATTILAGCGESGPPRYPVSGVVTYKGKALPTGSVMFIPQDGAARPVTSVIDSSGNYQLETVAGPHAVQIQMVGRLRGQPALDGEGAKLDIPEVDWLIPEKYNHCQTSGIQVVVEPDSVNQIDLPLK